MIIIIIILFIAYFFILVSNQKNIETFISISNSLMHSKSPNIFKSILYIDNLCICIHYFVGGMCLHIYYFASFPSVL